MLSLAGYLAGPAAAAFAGGVTCSLGLPRSPVAAITFILLVLAATYALLITFIRVGVPSPGPTRRLEEEPDDSQAEDNSLADNPTRSGESEAASPAGFGPVGRRFADWGEEADDIELSPPRSEEPSAPPAESPGWPEPPLRIEAINVRGIRLAVGDTASQVMMAFRPGEGEMTPLIERNERGEASHVTRSYVVGRQPLTIVLEREAPGGPLLLKEILVSQ